MADSSSAAEALSALADPQRRAIVELLGEGPRSVGALAAELPISRPAVSRHLALLGRAGLVASQAKGTSRIYQLRGEGIEAIEAYLRAVWGEAAARFRLVAENTTPAGEDT